MLTFDEFLSSYKTLSNAELINILEHSRDYQPLAIEAAKKEYSDRQLSETDVKEAKEILSDKQRQKEKQRNKAKAIEDGVKKTGFAVLDTINPIQSGIRPVEKTLRIITIVFIVIFLYPLFTEFSLIKFAFEDFARFPVLSLITILPFILSFVGIFAFWKRKSIGWILFTVCITFFIVGVLWILLNPASWTHSDTDRFDTLFQRPSISTYISQLLFLSLVLYVLCKENIRQIFSIGKNKATKYIVVTGIVTIIMLIFSDTSTTSERKMTLQEDKAIPTKNFNDASEFSDSSMANLSCDSLIKLLVRKGNKTILFWYEIEISRRTKDSTIIKVYVSHSKLFGNHGTADTIVTNWLALIPDKNELKDITLDPALIKGLYVDPKIMSLIKSKCQLNK